MEVILPQRDTMRRMREMLRIHGPVALVMLACCSDEPESPAARLPVARGRHAEELLER